MTRVGFLILGILAIRGIAGIVQDCNYFYGKEFNKETFEGWLDTFKRKK